MKLKYNEFFELWHFYTRTAEDALNQLLPSPDIPSYLAQAMSYSVFAGGKRLRPSLMLATAKLFGDYTQVLPLAAAIEMIHTYSLIHDDLPAMDNDELRRGKLTNHVMFGESMAILAGDALLNRAFEVILENVPEDNWQNYQSAAKLIAQCSGARGMVAGQVEDMNIEKRQTEEKLLAIHNKKTGMLIKASVLGSALTMGADAEARHNLECYAQALGIAFQAADDILDVEGNSSVLGKSTGKDEESSKVTFVSVYGLDAAKELAAKYTQDAVDALDSFGDDADFLRFMAEFMLTREK